MRTADKLNPRQQRFISEYLKDLNGTQAVIRAGYSKTGAEVTAVRLLANPKVASEVQKAQQAREKRTEVNQDRVVLELARMAFTNMLDYVQITDKGEAFVDLSKLTREQAAAIQEITVDEAAGGVGDGRRERVQRTRFKLADKRGALELLGRHLGMFNDKLQVSGELRNLTDDQLNDRWTRITQLLAGGTC
jgi:phage terminase small subunit